MIELCRLIGNFLPKADHRPIQLLIISGIHFNLSRRRVMAAWGETMGTGGIVMLTNSMAGMIQANKLGQLNGESLEIKFA
jgi:hypothetical protein